MLDGSPRVIVVRSSAASGATLRIPVAEITMALVEPWWRAAVRDWEKSQTTRYPRSNSCLYKIVCPIK